MRIENFLEKGVEYTLSNTAKIISSPKRGNGGIGGIGGHTGGANTGSSTEEDVEVNFLWDPDTEMLHFHIERESASDNNSFSIRIELFDSKGDIVLRIHDVNFIPGTNIFQILLVGCLIKNDPGNDSTKLINEIEKIEKLEGIPEIGEFKSKYLNSLEGNPLGAFNKHGERIFQKHTEKIIKSIELNLPESVGPTETSVLVTGQYSYCLNYIENGEIVKTEDEEAGKLEEINFDIEFIARPGGTKFEQGRIRIPENTSADTERTIQGIVKINKFEKEFTIVQSAAKLTYSVSHNTPLTKEGLPIFVLSGSGGSGELVISDLNTDVSSLQYQFPNFNYISWNANITKDNEVIISILATYENNEHYYRPSEPELYNVLTKEAIPICSFYVVQAVKQTNFPISIVAGDLKTKEYFTAGKDEEFAVTAIVPNNVEHRYWTCSVYNKRGGAWSLVKNNSPAEEGVVFPAMSSTEAVYNYLYKLNTFCPFVEHEEVIGSVTIVSPNTGMSALNLSWENVALSDTKTINLVAKEGEKHINIPETLRFDRGIGVYYLEIVTNRTLLISLPEYPRYTCFEDETWTKTVSPISHNGQIEMIILPIRYFGPSPKEGIIDSSVLGEIMVREVANQNNLFGKIRLISQAVDNTFNIKSFSGEGLLGREDSSLFLAKFEGGNWEFRINSPIRIFDSENEYTVEIDWNDFDLLNGSPVQIISGTIPHFPITGLVSTITKPSKKILEFNPTYYGSSEKRLGSNPILILQKGRSPGVIMSSGGSEETNPQINITPDLQNPGNNISYENNQTLYWNVTSSNNIRSVKFSFYCRYVDPVYYGSNRLGDALQNISFTPTNSQAQGFYYNVSKVEPNEVVDGESGNGKYFKVDFVSDPIARSGGSNGDYSYSKLGKLTFDCVQLGVLFWTNTSNSVLYYAKELGRKSITIDVYGGIPSPTIVGNNILYAGTPYAINNFRVDNIGEGVTITSVDRRLIGESSPIDKDYTGIKIETDNAHRSFNSFSIKACDPIFPSSPYYDIDWRYFKECRYRKNNEQYSKIYEGEFIDQLEDEELVVTLSNNTTLTYPIIKRGYRGHITIEDTDYGPEFISSGIIEKPTYANWKTKYEKTVSWDTTYVRIIYTAHIYGYDGEDDVIMSNQHFYMSFPPNGTGSEKTYEAEISVGDIIKLPVKITQSRFTYNLSAITMERVFPASGGYGTVFEATTSLSLGDFTIENSNEEDVTEYFFCSKKNGILTIAESVEKNNVNSFKISQYNIKIRELEESEPPYFFVKQEGIETRLISPEGQTSAVGIDSEHRLSVSPREEVGTEEHEFRWDTKKYIENGGPEEISNSRLRLRNFVWNCVDPADSTIIYSADEIFSSYETVITEIEGAEKDYYFYNKYIVKSDYISTEISITVQVEIYFEGEENFSDELTMYLLKEGVSQ